MHGDVILSEIKINPTLLVHEAMMFLRKAWTRKAFGCPTLMYEYYVVSNIRGR